MRILVTDGMDKTAMAQLREQGHEVVEQFYEPDQLGAALRDFDVAVVRSKTKVRKEHIDAAKGGKLKMIIRGGVGVDNIDVKYAEENGITVKNTPRASSQSVAELAMGHMLPAPGICPSPVTPCARASGRRRPMARASSCRARPWASWASAASASTWA
ncbi:MAG: hypothetical protein V8S97_00190 [Oscillospiraceae bacterium]